MKKLLIIIATVCLVLGLNYGASAWVYVPAQGDTNGWLTYTYTAGPEGFTGTAGFVSSNAGDNYAYSELLIDNLQGGGGINPSFELGNLTGYTAVSEPPFLSSINVTPLVTGYSYNAYTATNGTEFADIQSYYINDMTQYGVTTSQFTNASGDPGTTGGILETEITLAAGALFSFDWAFLAGDTLPGDFALFYLKDASGNIVFSEGLAQIGASAVPIPGSALLLGSGLLGLLGLRRRGKKQVG
jgi:hypothetical protein